MYDDVISCGFFLMLDTRFLSWRAWDGSPKCSIRIAVQTMSHTVVSLSSYAVDDALFNDERDCLRL